MELIIGVGLLALLLPIAIWLGDEHAGRARWRRVLDVRETLTLGEGAFREVTIESSREELLRERAPWWVRALALSCYLPIGAAIVSALPWLLGAMILTERNRLHGLEGGAHLMLVIAYPIGCWAAVRMAGLGRALLSGDRARFFDRLWSTAPIQLTLNVSLLVGALALFIRYRSDQALWLFIAPSMTLAQLGVVAWVGATQTDAPRGASATDASSHGPPHASPSREPDVPPR